jgi:hypothetical protein
MQQPITKALHSLGMDDVAGALTPSTPTLYQP